MKKLLLLLTVALASYTADAQNAGPINLGGGKQSIDKYKIRSNTPYTPAGKSTASGGRWYNHAGAVDFFNGGAMDFRLLPIWFDSTVLQNFTTGLSPINYISVAQIVDPIYFTMWSDPNVFDPNLIQIMPYTPYSVDSISFTGAYVKNPNRSDLIVDTLILSVSASSTSTTNPYSYYFDATDTDPNTDDDWVNNYVPNPGDEIRGFTIHRNNVDVVNRASNVAGRLMWKLPLDTGLRTVDSAGFVNLTTFTLPVMNNGVPGQLDVPAGYGVAMTITFKSGDVVIPHQDTFSEYHNFMLMSGQALGQGAQMPYYYYSDNDRNSSNLMFYFFDSAYYPSVFIEGWNTNDFSREFHDMAAHIKCTDCPTLNVKNINNNTMEAVSLYPNPADNEVSINFIMTNDAKAKVYITNAVGQLMASQNVNNVKAKATSTVKFSTANMASGVYFYTVEANGQRKTDRFVVSH